MTDVRNSGFLAQLAAMNPGRIDQRLFKFRRKRHALSLRPTRRMSRIWRNVIAAKYMDLPRTPCPGPPPSFRAQGLAKEAAIAALISPLLEQWHYRPYHS